MSFASAVARPGGGSGLSLLRNSSPLSGSTGLMQSGGFFANMPAAVLRPVLAASTSNPAAASQVASLTDSQVNALAQSVQNVAPTVAQAVSGGATQGAVQAAASGTDYGALAVDIASTLIATGEGAKWGVTGKLNEVSALMRRAKNPVKILPASAVSSAAGACQLTWNPQEAFEGFRLCVPSGQAGIAAAGATYLQQLTAGDRLMVTQSGRIPVNVLRENSECGKIDFPVINLGETITAQITGATATTEIGAVILGYGSRARQLPDGAEILYQRWEPFDVTSDPGSSTVTVNLTPQRNVIVRRLVLDDSVANFASLFMTFANVQDLPQYVSQVEIPASMFGELGVDDWLDWDMCQLGGQISLGFRNAAVGACNVQGMALVDVVRLANEARR